jgi:dephospho-CoA kinase
VPLVLVTGLPGAGKSAVCDELCRRGYEAHDTDREGNAVWVRNETGEIITQADAGDRPVDWSDDREWRLVHSKVAALARRGQRRLVFLCGSTANENEVWELFSSVVYLAVDETTLRRRLASRTSNDFGKAPGELAAILEWHRDSERMYREFGVHVIDATLPLDRVVDLVVEASTGTC